MDTQISVLISIIFVCHLDVTYSKQCVKHDNCICVFDDDSGMIDLSSIGKTDGNPLFYDYPATVDEFYYSYNPCGPFTELTCVDVAACQYSSFYFTAYDIGVPDKVSFNYDGLNVIANYASEDGARQSFVTFVCDPGATTPILDVLGESATTQYYMTLTAAAACPVPSPFSSSSSGISAGSVLLIIFFVLLAVYLAVGFAFNKFKREANGKELVPNVQFWTDLPALIRDGFKFTLSLGCRRSAYGAV